MQDFLNEILKTDEGAGFWEAGGKNSSQLLDCEEFLIFIGF